MAIQAVAYDLDGVIYRGKVPILGVVESIRELQQAGIMTFFMTNNSSKDRSDYQRALGEIGINADQACIYTSGVALAAYCKSKGYRKAFVIGESGLFKVLEAQGIEATSEKPQGGWRGAFDCVAVGLDRKFTYQKLDFALQAINGGAKFLAANTDTCLAREEDVAPGTGCLVEALSCACGKKPDFIAGKPHTYMINELLDDFKLDKSQLVFVGDRLDTDIACARAAGIKSVLVLTGLTSKSQAQGIKSAAIGLKKNTLPDFILDCAAQITPCWLANSYSSL